MFGLLFQVCDLGVCFGFNVVWVWILLLVCSCACRFVMITLRLRFEFVGLNFMVYTWICNLDGLITFGFAVLLPRLGFAIGC